MGPEQLLTTGMAWTGSRHDTTQSKITVFEERSGRTMPIDRKPLHSIPKSCKSQRCKFEDRLACSCHIKQQTMLVGGGDNNANQLVWISKWIIGQSNSISLNYPYLLGRPRTSDKIEISLRHGQQSDAPGDELVVESQRSLLSLSKGTKVLGSRVIREKIFFA